MKKISGAKGDREILDGIRTSRKDIIEHVYQRFYPMIYKLVITHNGNKEEARDIFQDGLLTLYEKTCRQDFQLTSSLSTYLYAICRRLWLNRINRQKKRELLGDKIPDQAEEADFPIEERQERKHLLHQLLHKIGESCRQILMKKYFEQLRDKEIALALNFSGADYVKTQRYRCLKQLKSLYMQWIEND
jgi:RNA polymerase sigma factor (sigma-70 family)